MLMKSRRLLGTPLSILGAAGLAAVLLLLANLGASESRYIDLRRIEPIHGDVAAGARKAATQGRDRVRLVRGAPHSRSFRR